MHEPSAYVTSRPWLSRAMPMSATPTTTPFCVPDSTMSSAALREHGGVEVADHALDVEQDQHAVLQLREAGDVVARGVRTARRRLEVLGADRQHLADRVDDAADAER